MRFTTFLLKNLLRRKTRSLLTCAGVAIAVGTTVALLGVSRGFESSMASSFADKGTQIVVTAAGIINQLNSDLDESIGDRLLALEGVRDVAPGLLEMISYDTPQGVTPLLVQGWPVDSYIYRELRMLEGDGLVLGQRSRLVVGKTIAKTLGLQVGQTVGLEGEEFTVAGIFESAGFFDNNSFVLEMKEYQKLMAREGSVTGFSLITHEEKPSTAYLRQLCDQIAALTDARGKNLRLGASPTDEYAQSSTQIKMAHAMAWTTSAIAIVVGSIGVLNTMVMSVVERIREISILRAMGWRKSRVVRMIVGESLLLSLLGAVLGTLGAIALTKIVTLLPVASGFIEGQVSPSIVARGFGLATLVALFGGLYPAYRATQLLPSEGLRHE